MVVESSDKTLQDFYPLPFKVVHNSSPALTYNESFYLAPNFPVEKSMNNGPASLTLLKSNLGFKTLLVSCSNSKQSVVIFNSNSFVVGSTDEN